jgi:hypothetical protein
MSSAFKDKLRKIRDESVKRSEVQLRLRSEEDLQRSQRTVRAFEFREAVEAVIEEFARNLQGEVAGFVLTRGFFEGKYMLALRLEEELRDEQGRAWKAFSRLMFLLEPHADDDRFAMQAKKTVRNRDLETLSSSGPMNPEGQAEFARFVESQFLDFAESYFGETKPSGVGS